MEPSPVPANRLDPKAPTVWRIQAALPSLALALGGVAATVALAMLGTGPVLTALPAAAAFVLVVLWLTVVPAVRYRRWRWEVTEQQVRLQKGLIVIERVVIPMARIQHVDTTQGPIMGAFDLSEVRVWTAAGHHAIPALSEPDAAALRDRIASLVRMTDDGGL